MNIAKLNTASLDDKTFIIKRGTSGGGTPDTPSGSGDVFYVAAGDDLVELAMAAICSFIKYRNEETGDILIAGPGAYFAAIGDTSPMIALAFLCLGDLEMYDGDNKTTVRGKYEELKQFTTFTEITKEQFYSLE